MRAWRNGRRARLRGVFVTECGFKSHRSHQNRATCFFCFRWDFAKLRFARLCRKTTLSVWSQQGVRVFALSCSLLLPEQANNKSHRSHQMKKTVLLACFWINSKSVALTLVFSFCDQTKSHFVGDLSQLLISIFSPYRAKRKCWSILRGFLFCLNFICDQTKSHFVGDLSQLLISLFFALSRQTKWITGFVMLSRRRDSSTAVWMTTATRRNISLDSSTQSDGWRRTSVRITRQWVRLTS